MGFTEEQFFGVKRLMYRIKSGAAWAACEHHKIAANRVKAAHSAFAKANGGLAVYAGTTARVGNGVPIYAVLFEGELPAGWKWAKRGRFDVPSRSHKAAKPDKRTKVGRDLVAQIAALPFKPDPDEICAAIGFPTSVQHESNGRVCYESFAFDVARVGWIEQTFYLSLADYVTKRAKMIADGKDVLSPEWSPIEGMELILKEEADLDFAKSKAAKSA